MPRNSVLRYICWDMVQSRYSEEWRIWSVNKSVLYGPRPEYSGTEPWIVTQTVPLTPALKERSHLSHTVYCAGHFQTRDRDGEGRGITEPWITIGCWNIQHMWHKYKSGNSRVCVCVCRRHMNLLRSQSTLPVWIATIGKNTTVREEKTRTSVWSDRLIPGDWICTSALMSGLLRPRYTILLWWELTPCTAASNTHTHTHACSRCTLSVY